MQAQGFLGHAKQVLSSRIKSLDSRLVRTMLAWAGHADSRQFLLDMLPKNSAGAEIGVHVGDFSRLILETVVPKEFHLIDPWKHETSAAYKDAWYGGLAKKGQAEMNARYARVCRRFDREIRAGRVTVHRGFSTDVLDRFPDGHLDWIYIDGNHLYEFVKKDLELAFRKTKKGGYIAGDDYSEGGWWGGGVKKAVDEFLAAMPVRLIAIRHGQFVIQT